LNGNSFGAELYLSKPRKTISLDYRIPKDNPIKDFLSFQVGFKQVDENQTRSDTFTLGVQRQWGAINEENWNKIAFIKAEQETFTQGLQDEQKTLLVIPGFTLNRTRKRGDIFVDWGDRQLLTVEGASADLLSDIDFFKVTARTKWIRQFDKHRLVIRADAGAISTSSFERLPSSQRFFAGGAQSIRGFGLNEVSTIRQVQNGDEIEDEIIGGKYLSVASVEYAYNIAESWRAAVFVDAGSAGEKFAQDLATGIGVGVHWLSPIGSVRIYIANGKSDFEEKWQLHLVIGPGL
jgi:translocation and assembly module TamA